MPAYRAAAAATMTVVLASLGTAGCNQSSDAARPAALSSAAATPAENGIDRLSAKDLLEKARTTLEAEPSYRLTGQTSKGPVDLTFVKGKGTTGTTTVGGHQLTILATGGAVYVKSEDPSYYESAIAPGSAALIGALWVQLTPGQAKELAVFADPSGFAKRIFTGTGDAELTGVTTVDGSSAVGVLDTGDGSTLWVSAKGSALPLRLEERGAVGDVGVLRFTDIGAEVPIEAPAGDQIFTAPDPTIVPSQTPTPSDSPAATPSAGATP